MPANDVTKEIFDQYELSKKRMDYSPSRTKTTNSLVHTKHKNEQKPDPREGDYFVSVYNSAGDDVRLALGPFSKHQDALDQVERVRKYLYQYDPKAPWYAYGTARREKGSGALGVLNEKLGYTPEVELIGDIEPWLFIGDHAASVMFADRTKGYRNLVGLNKETGQIKTYVDPKTSGEKVKVKYAQRMAEKLRKKRGLPDPDKESGRAAAKMRL
jgi:hypothetical protein